MSRLTDLLGQVKAANWQLGSDLEAEFKEFSNRRAFGLNFEKHQPEAVELPLRLIRKGDKVRVLPKRGKPRGADQTLWRVNKIETINGSKFAKLSSISQQDAREISAPLADLVVVAEFFDPIYPGLASTGKVERGGDKPFHTVINAENFHALQALVYTHSGKIDCIYIDPPYNSGAKDWKYNNDYVEEQDLYRHSKWLAFMERRLKLAKGLLNPNNSVLIVTIDDKEFARLSLLLEQVFHGESIQMITSVINPRGKYREGEFARCEEYIFIVMLGSARVQGEPDNDFDKGSSISWRTLRRSDITSARGTSKGGAAQFYPIYVNKKTNRITEIGEPLPHTMDRKLAPKKPGCATVFPLRENGHEMNWGLTGSTLRGLLAQGYVRVGKYTPDKPQEFEISYLTSGRIADIKSGRASVVGRDETGAVLATYVTHKVKMPVSTWVRPSHNAETGGTAMVRDMLGEKGFPYPKSLYAVEDVLRLFVQNNPQAIILDFFSGSGTTAHAVMRLNKQDGGRRQSICVTNNEVSEVEHAALRKKNLRPGDPDWEAHGICEYITKPRIRAAVTGRAPSGEPLKGVYKFTDEFPLADGFEENVEFFNLTYESPWRLNQNYAFASIAPLLWLRAGSVGRRIEALTAGWDVADVYGVIEDLDESSAFLSEVAKQKSVRMLFIVTNDELRFQMICSAIPDGIEAIRLYESYLQNFEINTSIER